MNTEAFKKNATFAVQSAGDFLNATKQCFGL